MNAQFERSAPLNPTDTRLLVADDVDYARTIVGEILRGAGIRDIVGVSSADEALEALPHVRPQMLIIDWNMGGMDGNELTRSIRSGAKAFRNLPIIMLSGEARRTLIETARDSGVDEFVAKPVSSYSIITRVKRLARRPRLFIECRNYAGPCRRKIMVGVATPMRRLTDQRPEFTPQDDVLRQRALGIVAQVHASAQELQPHDRRKLFALYEGALEAQSIASDSSDQQLLQALASLLRYLQGIGASGRMQANIIGAHFKAIKEIIALPASCMDARRHLVDGLESAVTAKFNEAA